jgi:hypothetical protein
MATINPHTTRATGTILTAAIYNGDHVNHVNNANSIDTMPAWTIKLRNAASLGKAADAALADITTDTPTALDFALGFKSTGEIRKFGALASTNYVPTAFTSVAIQAAVDAAAAAGGGVVQLRDGDYAISSAVIISSDDIWVIGSGDTRLLAPASATSIAGLLQITGTLGTDTTLAVNSVIGDRTITLTSAANVAVGDYVRIDVIKVTSGYFYHLETKCTAKAGSDITLADPMPFAMTTADTTSIRQITLRHRVKIKGLRFGGNGNSGTTRGLFATRCAYSSFEDLYFEDFTNAAAAYIDNGYRNYVGRIAIFNSGNVNESDVTIRAQTGMLVGDIRSAISSGFGPQFMGVSYCSVRAVISDKAANRGIKLAGSVFSSYGSLIGCNSGSTGVAVSLGSCDNTIDSVIALSNRGGSGGNDVGLWFSAQDNCRNLVGNCNLQNNQSWDLFFGASDNDNKVADIIATSFATRSDVGLRNVVGRMDGFIMGGYSVSVNANAVGDTIIPIECATPNFRISSFVIQNVGTTASLTAAQFGIFTGAGATGITISAAGQSLAALTSNTTGVNGAIISAAPATLTSGVLAATTQLFFRITTAQGAAATLRVYAIIQPLPTT